jgi:hypothetical protein
MSAAACYCPAGELTQIRRYDSTSIRHGFSTDHGVKSDRDETGTASWRVSMRLYLEVRLTYPAR